MKQGIKLSTSVFLTFIALAGCRNLVTSPSVVETRLDSLIQTVPDFSGVLLVAEEGKPIYHKAFGYRDFKTKESLDTGAVFELASVSKQFTAMTIMMLSEQNKLDYDDLVEKHIPGLPYPGITIRHLLHHTSGLPDYLAVMDQYWDKTKVAGNKECIDYMIRYHPPRLFEPGVQYSYSNTGYLLLASIAERVSGHDFIAFSKTHIFVPLEMTMTDFRTREEKQALQSMAFGHLFVEEQGRYLAADSFPAFNYAIWLGNRTGPGRISSTATDLLKWDRALYTEKMVRQETLNEAFHPATLNDGMLSAYGFGWQIADDSVMGKTVRHGGDNPGYRTHILRYIDKDKTVILLCNNAHSKFHEIMRGIEGILAKESVR